MEQLTNTCIIEPVKSMADYIVYLLDENRHKGEQIYHNNVIDKMEQLEYTAKEWKSKQESKKGWAPKPLSLVLSFPAGTDEKIFIAKGLERLHKWVRKISEMNDLNLSENDIEEYVKNIPFVAHYKGENPHLHCLIPKIFPNKNSGENEYINIYTFKYTNKLYQISGWNIKEKIQDKQNQDKIKAKNPQDYYKQRLMDEVKKYESINDKLDKFIALIIKDINKGHTDKAITKIKKLRKRNGR